MKRFNVLIVVALLGYTAVLAGCQATPPQKAAAIRSNIETKTAEINQSVDAAQGHIAKADQAVGVAATQPANPPVTRTALNTAHTELGAAQKALDPVRPATANIDTNAVAAEAVTTQVSTALTKEQNHWIGKKGRDFLLTAGIILGALALVGGILAFVLKTNGLGPVVYAADEVFVNAARLVWKFVKVVPKFLYHVMTLGLSKFADLVNKHYDKQNPPITIINNGASAPAPK